MEHPHSKSGTEACEMSAGCFCHINTVQEVVEKTVVDKSHQKHSRCIFVLAFTVHAFAIKPALALLLLMLVKSI